MDADDYINSKKELQQIILDFIDNDNSEDYFLYFTLKFKLDNIGKDLKEFKALLHLILNISNQIKNYGGSYFERHLVNQIKMTADDLNIQSLKILIDGENEYLSEGTIF